METKQIECPKCKYQFNVSESLRSQVEEELKAAHAEEIKAATSDAVAQVRKESAEQMKSAQAEIKRAQDEAEEAKEKAQKAQEAEVKLRQDQRKLEQDRVDLNLEIARRADEDVKERVKTMQASFDKELENINKTAQKDAAEAQDLKMREKDILIDRLKDDIKHLQLRTQSGSQEIQGEALETALQESLVQKFPQDRIEPVPKGMRGADIIQYVQDSGKECGSIIWEAKNTKNWQADWLDKLKENQHRVNAHLPVLVSAVLPNGVDGFSRINGVWVVSVNSWPGLATVLREQIIQVAYARVASEGKDTKMSDLYDYLVGDEFVRRVTAIADAFKGIQLQVQKERRAMESHWRERETLAQRAMTGATNIHGSIRGIVGGDLPSIPVLEIENKPLLENREED